MTEIEKSRTNKRVARIAGLLYMIVIVTGFFSIVYVPMQIMVEGDASATVANIVTHKSLLALSIIAGVICYTAFILLPLILNKLLGHVNKVAGTIMVTFALISVPMSLFNLSNRLNVLSLLSGADHLKAFTTEQLHAQIMISLEASSNGILICTIFWGLWLLPFGYLVFKSGFLPKVLGIMLMAGCFGYLIHFYGVVFVPGFTKTTAASLITLPSAVGEIGICLWLLIVGVRKTAESVAPTAETAGT